MYAHQKTEVLEKQNRRRKMDYRTYLRNYPDKEGRFGPYGGAYLTEELKPAFEEISEAYQTICHSSQFINELRRIRREFQGRRHRFITVNVFPDLLEIVRSI